MENDIEDKLLRIQEENMILKKQVHEANNDIKLLTTRLHRLLDIKKQTLEKAENKNLVNLDDMVFNLKLKMSQLESENVKLHQRSLVLQTKLDAIRRRRQYKPMYSSVPSRTDSGIDWFQSGNSTKPSSARLMVHHRSSSIFSLNRITFNSGSKAKMSTKSDIDNSIFICPNKTMDESQIVDAGVGIHKQTKLESHQYQDNLMGESSLKNTGKTDLSLQMLKETQDEIGRLQEIIILQQQYIDSLQSDSHQLRAKSASNGNKTKSSKEKSNLKAQKQAFDSLGLTIEASGKNDDHTIGSSNDYHKLSQVFKTSDGSGDGLDLEKMLTTKTIPNEIIDHIDRLSKEVSESQNIIKSLRSQLVNNNLATIKIAEMQQKLDNLALENEILQKSLQNCIGTCISDLEKEFNDDYTDDNNNPKAIESNSIHKELTHLQDKLKKLVIENAKQAQSLEEKNQLIDLLQVKYNNLKEVYDLMISSNIKLSLMKPNSPLTASTNSTNATLARSWLKSDSIDSSLNIRDEGIILQSNEDHNNKKVAILDSLGHVREMVECVRSELENTDSK